MDKRIARGMKTVWLTAPLLAQLDAARGDVPRQRFVVRILEREMARIAQAEASIDREELQRGQGGAR